jgi:hypothetical protein
MSERKVGQMRRHLKVWMAASDSQGLVGPVNFSSRSFAITKEGLVQMG